MNATFVARPTQQCGLQPLYCPTNLLDYQRVTPIRTGEASGTQYECLFAGLSRPMQCRADVECEHPANAHGKAKRTRRRRRYADEWWPESNHHAGCLAYAR